MTDYPAPIQALLLGFAALGALCLATTGAFVWMVHKANRHASGGHLPTVVLRHDSVPAILSPGYVEVGPDLWKPVPVPTFHEAYKDHVLAESLDNTAVGNAFGIPEHLVDPPTQGFPVNFISYWRPMTERQVHEHEENQKVVNAFLDSLPPDR
jgi:hypothetical protein